MALATTGIVLSGCSSNAPSADSLAENLAADVTPRVENVAADSGNDGNASATNETSETKRGSTPETFEPPFPNRTDLFAQPTARKAADVVRQRQQERSGDVQLKGFAQVDGPRAMLRLDGQLWIAGPGEIRDGIRVISITPPSVKLQSDGKNVELSLHDGR